jgi:hypothetical protein
MTKIQSNIRDYRMKYLIRIIVLCLLLVHYSACSQNQQVKLSTEECYDYSIPLLTVVNNKLTLLLDSVIDKSKQCHNVIEDSLIFVIRVLPIQGNFLVGGVQITRIEDVDHSKFELGSKGLIEYKSHSFIVYSPLEQDFHSLHWSLRKTDTLKRISFCIKKEVYEDAKKYKFLNWWYLYYPYQDQFTLSLFIDCNGERFAWDGKELKRVFSD